MTSDHPQVPDDHPVLPADPEAPSTGESRLPVGEERLSADETDITGVERSLTAGETLNAASEAQTGVPRAETPGAPVAGGELAAESAQLPRYLAEHAATAEVGPPDPVLASPEAEALERDNMAWPPAPWERAPSAWRDDVGLGPGPFQPMDSPAPVAEPIGPVEQRGSGRLLREILETGFLTLLIFLGIKLVVQNFKIQGASMETTLHDGQFLLVNKLLYSVLGQPQRGDIVVFEAWEQGGNGEERDFIKRVIGVPGDTIEIRDSQVLVNGEVLDEPYLDANNLTSDRIGPIVLGTNEYYVMGDNRGNSSDSRAYGPLAGDRVIGKAWLSYWPPGNIGIIPDAVTSFASGSSD